MNARFYIAWRYYRGRKNKNLIQRIGRIASLGVAVCAGALVVLLSVFNGFESLLIDRFDQVDADILILPASGKTISPTHFPFDQLRKLDSAATWSAFLEEKAVLRYRDREYVVTLRGVDSSYTNVTAIHSVMRDGAKPDFSSYSGAALGQGVAYYLGVTPEVSGAIQVYVPTEKLQRGLQAGSGFRTGQVWPESVFAVQAEYDTEWVLTSMDFMRDLLDEAEVSGYFVRTENMDTEQWAERLGPNYLVQNRFEQHGFIYRIMRTEKLAVFILFALIILIASFNFVGSLIMMLIDKRRDLFVLWSMGASIGQLRGIYALQSALINASGGIIGLMLGVVLTLGQDYFGWISLGGEGEFIVQAYPVVLKGADLIQVMALVWATGWTVALLPLFKLNEAFVRGGNHV